jgi:hypothetical protein
LGFFSLIARVIDFLSTLLCICFCSINAPRY